MTTTPTTVPEGETPNGTAPNAGETPAQANGETPGTKPPSDDATQKEIDRLKASLARANKEAKDHREKAEELDKLKAELEAAKLSEKEKLEKKVNDLQTQYDAATKVATSAQSRILNYEVRLQAVTMGIVDPDAAAQLLHVVGPIEYDAEGNPTNVETLLKGLLKAKPYLAGKQAPPSNGGGATNPERSRTTGLPTLSHAYIASLKPSDYNQMSDEQRQAISRFQRDNPHRF
jgi:hypothetical protein